MDAPPERIESENFMVRYCLLVAALLLLNAPAAASSSSYCAPFWLPGGHLQTIYPALFGPRVELAYRRERWELPDGDFVDADWIDSNDVAGPLIILFHGLEGNSRSNYALMLMTELKLRGWRGVVAHFRGASGEPNRLPRAYHAGDVDEIEALVGRVKHDYPDAPLYLVGVSLGGNAMLKWLGDRPNVAKGLVRGAVAVSAPLDLMATGNALDAGFNKATYTRNFLASLKVKALAKLEMFPDLYSGQAVAQSTTLREFDTLVTAPLHGFKDADDYWTRASSKPVLRNITVPTLLINARNDPFLPAGALPTPDEVSPLVTLDFPDEGGHAGFITSPFPGRLTWLPTRITNFFHAANTKPD